LISQGGFGVRKNRVTALQVATSVADRVVHTQHSLLQLFMTDFASFPRIFVKNPGLASHSGFNSWKTVRLVFLLQE
jgi:hypothetical protein